MRIRRNGPGSTRARWRNAGFAVAGSVAILCGGLGAPVAANAAAAPAHVNWLGFHHATNLASYSPTATAITTANAASLVQTQHLVMPRGTATGQPGPTIYSSPAVYRGIAYFGDNAGDFMSWNLATGAMLQKQFN